MIIFFNDAPLRRILEELQEFASKSKVENFYCVHQPLLNIPLLCITNVLIGNFVEGVMKWDDKESFLTGEKKRPL